MNDVAIHFSVWGGPVEIANLDRVLGEVTSAGYNHLAIPLRYCADADLAAVRRTLERWNVRAVATAGLLPNQSLAHPDPMIRHAGIERLCHCATMARELGATQINGVLYGPIQKAAGKASADDVRASAESLASAAEFAQGCGVRLAIEIVNRYESNLINTVDQALHYLALAAHPNVGLHLDTFHMSLEETDLGAAIRKALPYLFYFELSQSHRGDLTEGTIDLAPLLATVRELGYRGLIGVEAFTRSKMDADHADMLAIWSERFENSGLIAANAMNLIRTHAG